MVSFLRNLYSKNNKIEAILNISDDIKLSIIYTPCLTKQ